MAIKPTNELLELLNAAVARELGVSIQYMLQHFKMEGIARRSKVENVLLDQTVYDQIGNILKDIAIEEMKHATSIIERIYVLGGKATTKSVRPNVGNDLREFMKLDHQAEKEALELYRKVIKEARNSGDWKTVKLMKEIYIKEEEHLLKFEEFLNLDISEPDELEDIDAESAKVYTDDYFQLLNKAVAAEISAIVQYTNQHEKASQIALRKKESALEVISNKNKASIISDLLKRLFMQEMDHLEKICERIYLLGGECVHDPDPLPEIGETIEDILRLGKKGEDYAIVLYRKIVTKATDIGDVVTKRMFESILEDEDEHFWTLDDFF
ncbi:MAG: ferritin-like domain-containing protein [Promethearchaeota archaeon]